MIVDREKVAAGVIGWLAAFAHIVFYASAAGSRLFGVGKRATTAGYTVWSDMGGWGSTVAILAAAPIGYGLFFAWRRALQTGVRRPALLATAAAAVASLLLVVAGERLAPSTYVWAGPGGVSWRDSALRETGRRSWGELAAVRLGCETRVRERTFGSDRRRSILIYDVVFADGAEASLGSSQSVTDRIDALEQLQAWLPPVPHRLTEGGVTEECLATVGGSNAERLRALLKGGMASG